MAITIQIDSAVASVGIQAIATALGVKSVSDEESRVHLANHLRTITARLYVEGDQIKRETAAAAAAEAAAASKILVV